MKRPNRQWHGGKGSKPRPTDFDKFNDNFDKIFNKKDKDKKVSADQGHHT
tara:strand:+ start:345 stop:494 length:150 start_codon:yes stop_codon:yes gene_type:complete